MNFLVSLLMAARSITLVLSGVTPGEDIARFEQPSLFISKTGIQVGVALKSGFPKELRELTKSGTVIPIYCYAEFEETESGQIIERAVMENRLFYDIVTRRYGLTKAPPHNTDTLFFSNLDTLILSSLQFNRATVCALSKIRPEGRYRIRLSGVLGRTRVEALRNNHVDLMYYWDFKRPAVVTGVIPGRRLLSLAARE